MTTAEMAVVLSLLLSSVFRPRWQPAARGSERIVWHEIWEGARILNCAFGIVHSALTSSSH
jgi:hypothetical protein